MRITFKIIMIIFLFQLCIAPGNYGSPALSAVCKSTVPVFVKIGTQTKMMRPRSIVDDMRVTEKLGQGSFGVVYKAHYGGEEIALKQMGITDFNIQEINYLLELQGIPGIVKIYQCEKGVQNLYLAQELLYLDLTKNESLKALREKSFDQRLKLYKELVDTLVAVHDREILHHDIKTDNIMAKNDKADKLYLIDFGLATHRTQPFRGGTPMFFSPALVNDKTHYANDKDDVWAMTLSIAEMEGESTPLFDRRYSICIKGRFNIECQESLINNIDKQLDDNMDRYKEACSETAIKKFREALKAGLSYDEVSRPTVVELQSALETALNACHSEKQIAIELPNYTGLQNVHLVQKSNSKVSLETRDMTRPSNPTLNKEEKTEILQPQIAEHQIRDFQRNKADLTGNTMMVDKNFMFDVKKRDPFFDDLPNLRRQDDFHLPVKRQDSNMLDYANPQVARQFQNRAPINTFQQPDTTKEHQAVHVHKNPVIKDTPNIAPANNLDPKALHDDKRHQRIFEPNPILFNAKPAGNNAISGALEKPIIYKRRVIIPVHVAKKYLGDNDVPSKEAINEAVLAKKKSPPKAYKIFKMPSQGHQQGPIYFGTYQNELPTKANFHEIQKAVDHFRDHKQNLRLLI